MRPVFEWDQAKADSNFTKHGITFETAVEVFLDPYLLLSDATRVADGETRFKAVGRLAGEMVTVIFTRRGDSLRLISARRSNRPEERGYDR